MRVGSIGVLSIVAMFKIVVFSAIATLSPSVARAGEAAADEELAAGRPLTIVVMDPLAKELACDCVSGFAQRRYEALAMVLERRLGRTCRSLCGGNLAAYWDDEECVDLIVGKHADVLAQAKKMRRKVFPLASLTDWQGQTTFQGLFIVRAGSEAQSLKDLDGYRILFGPESCEEKHAAALAELRDVDVPGFEAGKLETVETCTDAANRLLQADDDDKTAAVISDYARVLLEGCHTIPAGSLRVIGQTAPVPFITVFATEDLSPAARDNVRRELLAAHRFSALLKLLESKDGFKPFGVVQDQEEKGAIAPRVGQYDDVKSKEDPLPVGAERRYGTARFRHGTRIESLAVSVDGRMAVAGSGGHYLGAVRAYDLTDGRTLYELDDRSYTVEAIGLSPDGKTLVTKQSTTLHLRDAATGEERSRIELPRANPRSITSWIAFSLDSSKLAVSADGKAIQIVDLREKQVVRSLANAKTVFAACFSPDGTLLASGGYNSQDRKYFATLWNVATGENRRQFTSGGRGFRSLAFSPDGKILAGAGDEAVLRLWDVRTGEPQRTFPSDGRRIRSVAFSPDGKTIAAAGDSIKLYHVATGKETLSIDRQKVVGLHFSADGRVLTAAVAGALHRWDTATGQPLTPQSAADSAVDQIVSTPDGRRILSHDEAGFTTIWDCASGRHLRRIQLAWQRGIAVSPDGRYLVAAVEDPSINFRDPDRENWIHDGARIRIYDLDTDKFVDRFSGFEGEGHDIMFSPDGRSLITVDHRDGTVRIWDFASGELTRSFRAIRDTEKKSQYAIRRAVLSPDGTTLAVGHNRTDRTTIMYAAVPVRLWDMETGKELHELSGHINVITDLAFSPTGKQLATCGGMPGDVFVWDVKSGKRVLEQLPDDTKADSVAFSPDGHAMVTAAPDGKISIWKTGDWAPIKRLQGHRDHVSDLHFTPDGQLLSGGMDTTIIAWDTPSLGR